MPEATSSLDYERSARKDLWVWAMLLTGSVFIYAGYTVDPLKNCDESGECAPWLVPLAGAMGWCALAMSLGLLAANPSRGCRVDTVSGDLVWWKNRTTKSQGDIGRIKPANISCIRLDRRGENDSINLYDEHGERLPYFDEDVIPWPYDGWIRHMRRLYPHIQLEEMS